MYGFSLQLLVRNVDEKLVMKVVLPHLTKLAKDSEMYDHYF